MKQVDCSVVSQKMMKLKRTRKELQFVFHESQSVAQQFFLYTPPLCLVVTKCSLSAVATLTAQRIRTHFFIPQRLLNADTVPTQVQVLAPSIDHPGSTLLFRLRDGPRNVVVVGDSSNIIVVAIVVESHQAADRLTAITGLTPHGRTENIIGF
jgi:hypothetical protein